eukprot:CAMPEP_0174259652 /NCGR_PEP_ID=MMETSP0439-20130205/8457_1 /TAXON_ID=0 /ORGANISM="Stereomyxa ramosa, Strain Chinc5" /LENGTH=247 /DNA_ID=CAMNT_0015343627 /DNA_START=194 /DNA_END=934 /DNA_ORIENTATION=+
MAIQAFGANSAHSPTQQTGHTVWLTARDTNKGQQALNKLALDNVFCKQLDVSSESSISEFLKNLKEEEVGCSVLINNAGIYLDGWDQPTFHSSLQTNVFGPALLTEGILEIMKTQGTGKIINISSGYGSLSCLSPHYNSIISVENDANWRDLDHFFSEIKFVAQDEMKDDFKPTYKISKAAMNAWTRIVSNQLQEQGHDNILINCVDPGWVRTDMGGSSATSSVEEGADTAVWLASEEAPHKSGFFW